MSVPFFSENTEPRRNDTQWKIATKILGAIRDLGGAGGLVSGQGSNFEFGGTSPNQVLYLKNVDDGLFDRIDAVQPSPNQVVQLTDGVANP